MEYLVVYKADSTLQAHFAGSQFWRAGLGPVTFWQVGISSPQIRQPLCGMGDLALPRVSGTAVCLDPFG